MVQPVHAHDEQLARAWYVKDWRPGNPHHIVHTAVEGLGEAYCRLAAQCFGRHYPLHGTETMGQNSGLRSFIVLCVLVTVTAHSKLTGVKYL